MTEHVKKDKVNILLLVVLFVGFTSLVALLAFWGYEPYLYFVSMGAAVLTIPLVLLIKRGEMVFLVLGLFFLAHGVLYTYFASPWGPGGSETVLNFLAGFSLLGVPLALLCLSIFVLWSGGKSTSKTFEVVQFSICVFLHLANFVFAMLYPWSEITRFGGAVLAVGFGILNFIRVLGR